MRILRIPAYQLKLRDVLDEGQEIWYKAIDAKTVTVFWGTPDTSLLNNKGTEHKKIFGIDEVVTIVRR